MAAITLFEDNPPNPELPDVLHELNRRHIFGDGGKERGGEGLGCLGGGVIGGPNGKETSGGWNRGVGLRQGRDGERERRGEAQADMLYRSECMFGFI